LKDLQDLLLLRRVSLGSSTWNVTAFVENTGAFVYWAYLTLEKFGDFIFL
jgi:hypothetical protein